MAAKKKKKRAAPKKIARKNPPGDAYNAVVTDILAATPRGSKYRPAKPMKLRVENRRQPRLLKDLEPAERRQLGAIHPDDLATLLADPENDFEAAHVVDRATGKLAYRLYGWNYGVGYLFVKNALEIAGYGCQHDIEHWNLAQRDLFFAMDAALAKRGHRFRQPLSFCWWNEECWAELADVARGRAQSEPHLRKQLARAKAKTARA